MTAPAYFANGNISPRRFVKIDSTAGKNFNVIQASAASDALVGIVTDGLHNPPGTTGADAYAAVAGEPVKVFTVGDVCLVDVGGTITQGDLLTADANGKAVTASAGNVIGAIALEAGISGDVRRVQVVSQNTSAITGTITSTSANALAVGRNGTTNPVLQIDASTSSAATGVKVTGAAAAGGVAVAAISSGTNENLTIDAKGSGTITLNGTATGNVLTKTAFGYATGSGGTVTQATSRTTGVTLSKICGQITTDTSSLAAGAEAEFTVTNTLVAATDVVVLNITPGGTGTPFAYVSTVAAGSFKITVTNLHASTADTSADVINFVVLKGVAA